jgi:hypothetical protein
MQMPLHCSMDLIARSEADMKSDVVGRVRSRLPDVDEASVSAAVDQAFAGYADARVRTMLPILVERDVVEQLRPGRRIPTQR